MTILVIGYWQQNLHEALDTLKMWSELKCEVVQYEDSFVGCKTLLSPYVEIFPASSALLSITDCGIATKQKLGQFRKSFQYQLK